MTSANPFDDIKSKALKLKRATATPAHEKMWTETRAALLWSAPAFSNILYSMMVDTLGNTVYWTEEVPIAATDDKYLYLNPTAFAKYSLDNRVFMVAHEIMHATLNHCGQMHLFNSRGKISYADGSTLPFDQQAMNIAADLVINDLLIESKIGKFHSDWLHEPKIANGHDSVADAYRKVYKKQEDGHGPKGKSFDEHLKPGTGEGKDPTQAQQDRNQTEWQTAVASSVNAARVRGDLPAGLDRFFKELLEPQVSWVEHIRTLFARRVGNSTTSWQTLDPQLVVRGIGAPGRMGNGADKIVVAVDTSGSISQGMMDSFMGEVGGIISDLNPLALFLIQCDAKVQELRECYDAEDLKDAKIKGGGGTDFIPVFDKVADEIGMPDVLVYLTDGYGQFPAKAPEYPVIWGSISPAGCVSYPFGDVVAVPMPAA